MPISFDPVQVKLELKRLGKTQEDLARDLEVTAGTVNRWLTGKHMPLRVYQRAMKEMLDVYRDEAAA